MRPVEATAKPAGSVNDAPPLQMKGVSAQSEKQ